MNVKGAIDTNERFDQSLYQQIISETTDKQVGRRCNDPL